MNFQIYALQFFCFIKEKTSKHFYLIEDPKLQLFTCITKQNIQFESLSPVCGSNLGVKT